MSARGAFRGRDRCKIYVSICVNISRFDNGFISRLRAGNIGMSSLAELVFEFSLLSLDRERESGGRLVRVFGRCTWIVSRRTCMLVFFNIDDRNDF